jgi:hypothetical protein
MKIVEEYLQHAAECRNMARAAPQSHRQCEKCGRAGQSARGNFPVRLQNSFKMDFVS